MTPAATSGVDGVLGGRELEPGAALYIYAAQPSLNRNVTDLNVGTG